MHISSQSNVTGNTHIQSLLCGVGSCGGTPGVSSGTDREVDIGVGIRTEVVDSNALSDEVTPEKPISNLNDSHVEKKPSYLPLNTLLLNLTIIGIRGT